MSRKKRRPGTEEGPRCAQSSGHEDDDDNDDDCDLPSHLLILCRRACITGDRHGRASPMLGQNCATPLNGTLTGILPTPHHPASKPEVDSMRMALCGALILGWLAAAGGVSLAPSQAFAQEDVSPGSPGYFVKAGREYAANGNLAMAETYARMALDMRPDHPGARDLLAFIERAKAPPAPAAAPADPYAHAPSQASPPAQSSNHAPSTGASGSRNASEIGSAGYFLRFARDHLASGNFSGAESYAREALAVDPNDPEARYLLSEAQRGRQAAANSGEPGHGNPANGAEVQRCHEIYGACRASAVRHVPGSGYVADHAQQMQCMSQRNLCLGVTQ